MNVTVDSWSLMTLGFELLKTVNSVLSLLDVVISTFIHIFFQSHFPFSPSDDFCDFIKKLNTIKWKHL